MLFYDFLHFRASFLDELVKMKKNRLFFSSVADVPTTPELYQVEPFSSTAVIQFGEPEATGGVPIIKYRVQWRLPGQDWTEKEYSAEDGESPISPNQNPSLDLLLCFILKENSVWANASYFYDGSKQLL